MKNILRISVTLLMLTGLSGCYVAPPPAAPGPYPYYPSYGAYYPAYYPATAYVGVGVGAHVGGGYWRHRLGGGYWRHR